MGELQLTRTRIVEGVWEGVLTGAEQAPEITVSHLARPVDGAMVQEDPTHPGQFLVVSQLALDPDELSNILALMKNNRVLLEENSRYQMPPPEWLDLIKAFGVLTVRGGDIHSVAEL